MHTMWCEESTLQVMVPSSSPIPLLMQSHNNPKVDLLKNRAEQLAMVGPVSRDTFGFFLFKPHHLTQLVLSAITKPAKSAKFRGGNTWQKVLKLVVPFEGCNVEPHLCSVFRVSFMRALVGMQFATPSAKSTFLHSLRS